MTYHKKMLTRKAYNCKRPFMTCHKIMQLVLHPFDLVSFPITVV